MEKESCKRVFSLICTVCFILKFWLLFWIYECLSMHKCVTVLWDSVCSTQCSFFNVSPFCSLLFETLSYVFYCITEWSWLWATPSRESCPCLWQEGWISWSSRIPSNPSHSVILWSRLGGSSLDHQLRRSQSGVFLLWV